MTPHDSDHDDLTARLRALPAERVPPARVWQGIAAQLPAPLTAPSTPIATASLAAHRSRRQRWPLRVGLGMAAALAVLMVVPTPVPHTPAPSLLQRQADAMAGEYQQAIAALPSADVTDEWRPALHELDASADTIRAAIAENPRSRYLLGQLQRTYALRLELTQQAVLSAGLPT
ncbi:hypothetical protein EDF74_2684 [Stenotrophomonas rhizophila]|uniref:anti-sigma factor n=1 Tax=Stenotrophomonas TaxID=40323 RepID=UPI000F4BFF3D|nr:MULTISPECIES: anti-sigma factor [Stenotrophomonas]MCW6028448.1 anti-sigma factor [Stenotrophomonas sp. SRS1]ROP77023.1 hypothetical protein EDF74_2684 [Stenotrophomonas rhizophila]